MYTNEQLIEFCQEAVRIPSYSGQEKHIFYVVVDKYEIPRLRRLTREYDPEAFVIENSGVNIQGNFEKHLT